tara:strand:- start:594 stop:1211 length:618 start_codon:yes stop_codon:yes gene_type:complete
MRNNNIFYRILKLDKNIYNELITDGSSAQRAVAIWSVSYLTSVLVIFTLFRDFANFLKNNLSFIASGLPEDSLLELRNVISALEITFSSETTFTGLLTTLGTGLVSSLIGISFIFVITKYLFRKDPNFTHLVVIFGFSSVVGLLNIPILFINSFGFKLTIVFFTSIYSLVCLGSGLKQVYYLRNFETLILVLGSSIASSFLLEGF